ncbi:unnamed protein product [marine sediment metagenome]|uniref:Uncharacterized protein n=1 Tax=marine sediment metagenome TaxID=412755 RepID=X1RKI0_9ZZZZ
MKKLLRKRLLGIPLCLILAVLLTTTVVAATSYLVWQYNFQTEVKEPITVEVTKELTNPLYPGLGTNAEYIITNSGPLSVRVTAIWPGQEGPVSCYATIRYCDAEGTLLDPSAYITQVDYTGTATFNLPSDGSAKVQLGVLVFANAPPGVYNFPVSISRG